MALDLNYEATVLVNTDGMEKSEWLEWRRKGIGGSDAGVVLGVSPYKTARDVYFEKLGREPDVEDEGNWVAMEVGNRLEDLVALIFSRKTGYRVWQEKVMYQHPLYPYMVADVDYFFETSDGRIGILECKTGNPYTKVNWENGAVPYHYECQVRHYMSVKNLFHSACACLFGNSIDDFEYRFIDRDLDFEEAMIEQEGAFWYDNVKQCVEPPMSGDGDLILASLRRYKSSMMLRDEITIGSEYSDVLEQIWQMKNEKAAMDSSSRKLEKRIKTAYAKFAELLGNATKGVCIAADGCQYHITYKPVERISINKDNLEKMLLNDKELYQKYATTTESRPFQLKKVECKGE